MNAQRMGVTVPDVMHRIHHSLYATLLFFVAAAIARGQLPREDSLDRDYSRELPRIAPTEADQALGTFEVQPGFRLELVAAEPLVADPVAMCFDEHGGLYVVEMRGYSEDDAKSLGRVRRLVDQDGDGRFDKSTILLDDLSWPTAIVCYDGGVFVGVAPDILYCKDTDGDGRADRKQVVFTGFGRHNVQGLLNSFRWGLDNRIHGATSSNGGSIRSPQASQVAPLVLRGRDFAFDPRTRRMSATSGGGQHGMSFDRWGNKYVCSNSDHMQLVLVDDRYLARNPYFAAPRPRQSIAVEGPSADVFRLSPIEPWRIVRTRLRVKGLVKGPIEGGGTPAGYFTSATGLTMYRGDAYPKSYADNAFIGDVGGNLVHRKIVEPEGVSKVARRAEQGHEFIASTDIWFRPVQMANSPDGVLYILDMYREVIEHPLSLPPLIKRHLDLTSGRKRGRIYRVVPQPFSAPQRLWPGAATAEQLVQMLEHPNGWHRETAARLIYQRQTRSAIPQLQTLASDATLPEGRIRALYALAGLDALSEPVLLTALEDSHPRVKEHALRVSEGLLVDSARLRQKLVGMVNDEDAGVRFQLALSLGEVQGRQRNEALVALARRDGESSWSRMAIYSSLDEGKAQVFAQLALDARFCEKPTGRSFLTDLVRQIGAQNRTDEMAASLATIKSLPVADGAFAQRLVRALVTGAGKRAKQFRQLLSGDSHSDTARFVANLLAKARNTAVDRDQPLDRRVEAIRALRLERFDAVAPILQELLDPQQPPQAQVAAVQTIGEFDNLRAVDLLFEAWPTLSPRVRQEVLDTIFSRRSWLASMLDRIEQNQFEAREISLWRAQLLLELDDPAIRRRAATLLESSGDRDRQKIVDAYAAELPGQGDVDRGRQVFRKNCATCHRLEAHGHQLGPNLATMRNRGVGTILVNTLDPNRELDPRFENYVIQTVDGRIVSGIITTETATSFTLQRADSATDTVLRVEVEQLSNTGQSIMPEGMEKQIDKRAMGDLIAYILSVD